METVNNNDQMDMMMMQPPNFSGAYGDNYAAATSFPPLEFSDAANSTTTSNTTHNSTMPLVDLIDNPPMPWSSPSFTHLPSTTNTISFANNPTTVMLQEQEQTPALAALLSNSGDDSWRTTPAATEGLSGYATVGSEKRNSMAAMREMIFRIAAMQPIHIDPEAVKAPKRRNVKISKDPQSVAARHRRERISERIRILQRLVPGGTKMDTASMLDEAIHYVKFLQTQVQSLERANTRPSSAAVEIGLGLRFPVAMSSSSSSSQMGRTTPTPYLPLPIPSYQAPNVEH